MTPVEGVGRYCHLSDSSWLSVSNLFYIWNKSQDTGLLAASLCFLGTQNTHVIWVFMDALLAEELTLGALRKQSAYCLWFYFVRYKLALGPESIKWKIPERNTAGSFKLHVVLSCIVWISCYPILPQLKCESRLSPVYPCCMPYLPISHLAATSVISPHTAASECCLLRRLYSIS